MFVFSTILTGVLLFSGVACAEDKANDYYNEAQLLIDTGEYEKASVILKSLISSEPNNPNYYHLLGDILRKQGRLKEALEEYEEAKRLGGETLRLIKSIGTTHKWMRDYSEASASYQRVLQLDPNDEEAKAALNDLRLNRGLRLKVMAGGWEADYTKESYEIMLFYGGIDKLDSYAGYSYINQIYYTRHKAYTKGYYFYARDSYLKFALAYKDYNYPVDPEVQKPNPDSSSYDIVPAIELEVSHWLTKSFRGTLAYEFFRPTFFHDNSSTANNHKVSTELYYISPLEYLRFKVMYAILRDPDPGKTRIKGRSLNMPPGTTAASTNVQYQIQSLLGGGLEIVKDKWNAEIKYLPNRDLDSSYKYSVFIAIGFSFTDKTSIMFNYVYDKYSPESTYSNMTANVYLLSALYKLNPYVDIGAGCKYLNLPPRNEVTGFITLAYKTGLGF